EERALGGPRRRALLALLVAHAGRVVTTDELVDGLWGERVPGGPRKTVQVHVAALRRSLGPDHDIETTPAGYRLAVARDEIDALVHDDLVRAARAATADDPVRALAHHQEAAGLWRGEPYADLAGCEGLAPTIAALRDLRDTATEERAAVALRLGRLPPALADLEALVATDPLRERAWALLVVARYRQGHQGAALDAYQRARRHLVDELGVEPGPLLADVERRVLAHDPTLADPAWLPGDATPADPGTAGATGTAGAGGTAGPAEPGRGPRTLVVRRRPHPSEAPDPVDRPTALCCAATGVDAVADRWDLGDTADLLDRFRHEATAVLDDHGGTVVPSATHVVVAYFGSADGDGVAEAVEAGLAVVAAARALPLDGLPPPADTWGAQVGIATGARVPAEWRQPPSRPGAAAGPAARPVVPALVRADRLRALARPGQVLLSPIAAARLRRASGRRVRLGRAGDRRRDGGDGPVVGVPVVRPATGVRGHHP
ncbi:MAG TPA: BTAD domain-containing putative transcriptional regulator, partial [Acidimicrobiales bacterium]